MIPTDTAPQFGADTVVAALVEAGVDVFFANPGTSEIHLVSAIDRHPGARAVLCLFEGVATGAADGYARATGKPAAVLLHLGPGLANGLANLHNAYKAGTPMVVLVGEHATSHLQYDSPLRSDLAAVAGYAAKKVIAMKPGDDLGALMRLAARETMALPSAPVVVVANADVMWGPAVPSSTVAAESKATATESLDAQHFLDFLNAPGSAILLGGRALSADAIRCADRIAQATGCALVCETFNSRHERGAGVPWVERLPYFRELAVDKLAKTKRLLLAGSRPPVSFFGAPEGSSVLTAEGAELLAVPSGHDPAALLAELAELAAPGVAPRNAERIESESPTGALTPKAVWAAVNRLMPEGTVVSDESGMSSVGADDAMKGARAHTWLNLTGGSIGQGLPAGTGAAVGATGQVLVFHGDGGAMYTVQSLWTQAREQAKVVTVIFRNDRYAILDHEVKRHALSPLGAKGASMFSLADPALEWTSLARGMGVHAITARTAEEFERSLAEGLSMPGPFLIEAVMASPRKEV